MFPFFHHQQYLRLSTVAQYSLVIIPPDSFLTEIQKYREKIVELFGPLEGLQSTPHITLSIFKSSDIKLSDWIEYFRKIAATKHPFEITFDRLVPFSNGALVLLPQENSHLELTELIKTLHQTKISFPVSKPQKPHLSIARKLSKVQSELATATLPTGNVLTFECATLLLRKLEPEKFTYLTIEKIKLNKLQQIK